MASEQVDADVESPGFFGRNRAPRLITGFVITAVLIVAYLFGIYSYRSGVAQTLPEQSPPAGGVSVVIVPQKVSADDQTLPAQILLFPAADLLDASGRLTGAIEVGVEPALSGQALTFPADEPPAAQGIVLPAPGIVQQYPFDSYVLSATVHANASSGDALATEASLFFRIPGWSRPGHRRHPRCRDGGGHLDAGGQGRIDQVDRLPPAPVDDHPGVDRHPGDRLGHAWADEA